MRRLAGFVETKAWPNAMTRPVKPKLERWCASAGVPLRIGMRIWNPLPLFALWQGIFGLPNYFQSEVREWTRKAVVAVAVKRS